MNSNWSYSPETPNLGQIRQFLEPCDLEIWQMTLQNNRVPILCYFKLCASFCTHLVNSNLSYSLETLNSDQNRWFFLAMWPRNFTDDRQQGKSEGFDSCDRPSNLKLDSNCQFFCPCDREIWWMTLKNNRAPLLCYFKLCASFRSHWWIQTSITVRKRPIWVKFDDF